MRNDSYLWNDAFFWFDAVHDDDPLLEVQGTTVLLNDD